MRTFVISDTHFGHRNLFERERGGYFDGDIKSVEELDEMMIERWNKTVSKIDLIWHLGDIAMDKKHVKRIIPHLNGDKSLIMGNHDKEPPQFYLDCGFAKVRAMKVFNAGDLPGAILTHIPISPASVGRWGKNIHGHTHKYRVLVPAGIAGISNRSHPDSRYVCVSVEQTEYTPVLLDEILRGVIT